MAEVSDQYVLNQIKPRQIQYKIAHYKEVTWKEYLSCDFCLNTTTHLQIYAEQFIYTHIQY